MALNEWIEDDESAAEMLHRVLTDRPPLLLPPLHRVPLRVGNVVELVGSSASSKTQILMQAIVKCILPKDWNGVHYGGLERAVMFIDLDCRFDILRLLKILRQQILEANGALGSTSENDGEKKPSTSNYDELHDLCMRRFLYNRCYDSFSFLSILKTLHYQLQKNKECGIDVHVLMIDSIGAFHWIDRISSNRKTLSLHIVFEGIVREIKRLLLVHPVLILVTKSTILGPKSTNLFKRKLSSSESSNLRNTRNINQQPLPQEFMPLVWQSFVSHRVLLRASGLNSFEAYILAELIITFAFIISITWFTRQNGYCRRWVLWMNLLWEMVECLQSEEAHFQWENKALTKSDGSTGQPSESWALVDEQSMKNSAFLPHKHASGANGRSTDRLATLIKLQCFFVTPWPILDLVKPAN